MQNYFNKPARILTGILTTIIVANYTYAKKIQVNYPDQKPPGTEARLFAEGLVSSQLSEHSAPAFSPDGSVVLWTVVDKTYRGYLMEMRYDNGSWSIPESPSFADTTADDYYPSFSIDGKKLFFSSRRKMPPGYPETKDMRIWEVDKTAQGWGKPLPFDTTISEGQDYAHSITEKGTIYFSSALGGGTNWNIRKAEKVQGSYAKPELLPYSINSVDYEEGPYISPDERFLIFESQRPEGTDGSIDLYISFSNKNGEWGMPVNMGSKINSGSAERFARLSPDGKYLFFGSTRNNAADNWGFDIYWIDAAIINELRTTANTNMIIEQALGKNIIEALYKNDVQSSSVLLKKWLHLYPGSLDAIVIYSSILRKQGSYAEAEQLLATNTSPWKENTSIIMETGLVKIGLNKDHEAMGLLTPLLVPGEQLRERYIYLSKELLEMRKFKLSEEYFQKAMAIFPSSFPYFNRACALARIGEKDKAFEALNKTIELGGYNSKKDYENEPSLQSLKTDARWKVLMDKLK